MSTSALFEEQNCLQNPADCGKWISPMSAGACGMQISSGGSPSKAMECLLDGKVACLEKYAPLTPTGIRCKAIGLFGGWGLKCGVEGLKANLKAARAAKSKNEIRDTYNTLWRSLPYYSDITVDELKQLVSGDTSESDFLKRAYIPKACTQNAISLENKKAVRVSRSPSGRREHSEETFHKVLLDRLGSHSMGLTVDPGLVKGSPMKKGSAHAILINGMDIDPQTGKCLVKIKNSWGKDSFLQGWLPLDDVMPAIKSMYYFGDSKGKSERGDKSKQDAGA